MNTSESFPKDPVILLSYVNAQLRDRFPTLERLCAAHSEDVDSLRETLAKINYSYDEEANQFV